MFNLNHLETRIVPRFMQFIKNQVENPELYSFKDTGMTNERLYEAANSFIHIRNCNKKWKKLSSSFMH